MAVLSFKAYTLERFVEAEGAYDENGDYIISDGEWQKVCKCNAVPAGRMQQISLPDGQVESYSYTLNLPRDVQEFSYGERIRLSFQGHKFHYLTVKGFHRYQHQAKIWA